MKKVTIITATYNLIKEGREDYFKQMFESVQKQTYGNIEHLIIDGGSKDGTVKMIKKLKNGTQDIRIISEPDTGIYNAFNKGIKNATGDYIIFMNSDDYYCHGDAIRLLVEDMEYKKVDFSCADIIQKKGRKERIEKAEPSTYFYKLPFCHQTMFCKKELFTEFGLFDEKYKIASDYKFMIKVMYSGKKWKYINKPLATFRLEGMNAKFAETTKKEIVLILQELIYKNKYTNKEVKALSENNFGLKLAIKLLVKGADVKNFRFIVLKNRISLRYILQLRFITKPIEKLIKQLKGK